MSDVEKTVFISYRRSVSAFIARAIFMDLRDHGYDVFMDVESINSGQFDTIILNQIAARAHFLVVLTPGAVERCAEPGDWLRREIEYAIELQRNIVPVLVNSFSFAGTEKYLAGGLAELSRYSGLPLYHEYFDAAMQRLRKDFLKQPVYGTIRPTPPADQSAVQRKIAEVAEQPAPTREQLTAEQYFSRGHECYEHKDYQGAIENNTEAIRLNPNYADAYNNRGAARANQGDLPGALADFNEAIRLNPNYADAYANRGNAHTDQDDLPGALADYNEAIRLNPNYDMAYYNRGTARADQGDLSGAIADYNKALRLNPNYATAYNNRGYAYEQQGQHQKALADYDAALRIDPQYILAKNNRADLLKKMKK